MSDVLYIGVPIACLVIGAGWLVWEAMRIHSEVFDDYNERMDSLDRVLVDPEMAQFDLELQKAYDRAMRSVN